MRDLRYGDKTRRQVIKSSQLKFISHFATFHTHTHSFLLYIISHRVGCTRINAPQPIVCPFAALPPQCFALLSTSLLCAVFSSARRLPVRAPPPLPELPIPLQRSSPASPTPLFFASVVFSSGVNGYFLNCSSNKYGKNPYRVAPLRLPSLPDP